MNLSKGLGNIFKQKNLKLVFLAINPVMNFLGNRKDKIGSMDKSGIYGIQCSGCNLKMLGKQNRPLKLSKEYIAYFNLNRFEEFSVSQHIQGAGHKITIDNLALVRNISYYSRAKLI